MFKLPLETLCNDRISSVSKVTVLDVSSGEGEVALVKILVQAESVQLTPLNSDSGGKKSNFM